MVVRLTQRLDSEFSRGSVVTYHQYAGCARGHAHPINTFYGISAQLASLDNPAWGADNRSA